MITIHSKTSNRLQKTIPKSMEKEKISTIQFQLGDMNLKAHSKVKVGKQIQKDPFSSESTYLKRKMTIL